MNHKSTATETRLRVALQHALMMLRDAGTPMHCRGAHEFGMAKGCPRCGDAVGKKSKLKDRA